VRGLRRCRAAPLACWLENHSSFVAATACVFSMTSAATAVLVALRGQIFRGHHCMEDDEHDLVHNEHVGRSYDHIEHGRSYHQIEHEHAPPGASPRQTRLTPVAHHSAQPSGTTSRPATFPGRGPTATSEDCRTGSGHGEGRTASKHGAGGPHVSSDDNDEPNRKITLPTKLLM